MAQHDYDIANGGGAAVRADINNALAAVRTLNSGATAPVSPVAGMLWYDTATNTLKQRNSGNTAWVAAAELIAGGGQLAGMRNKIINGKMEIAQRGTSFAAGSGYTLDRWTYTAVTTAVATISQQADVPASNEFQYSYRFAVTTADTSIAAGDIAQVQQFIEGFNARDLIGRTFTLSFWVRSTKTGTHCVALTNSGANRSYVSEYTVSAANTWEYKTITVAGGLITAGTWGWTSGVGLGVRFVLACGTTFQTTANAWQTGDFRATSNQVNCLDSNTNIFAITGVQLEVGGVATPFEHRPIGVELALCQRYFQRPAAFMSGGTETTTVASFGYSYPVSMRVAPTFTAADNDADIRISGSTTTGIAGTWTASILGTEGGGFQFARTSGTWTANLPAFLNQSTAIANLSAEL